jgi:hypothetical protein
MADDAPGEGAAAPAVESRANLMAKFRAGVSDAADTSQAPAPSPPSPSSTGERAPASAEAAAETDPDDTDAAPDDDAIVDDDADTQDLKGHQAVKRAEVRMRQQLADERAKMQSELDRAVAEIRPRLERLTKLEQIAERGRNDFDAAAEFFGWTEDDMEAIGHNGFARSPKYKDKPEMKAYATRAMRERAEREERAAIKKRQDDLEAQIKQRDEQAAQAAARTQWLGGVKKLVDDKAPLVKRLIAKSPDKADRLLAATALELWEKTGAQPSDAAVIRELEKRRAAHRAEFVDEEPVAAAPDAKKPTDKDKADPKKPDAKPTNGANGAPKFKTRDEALAAFRAGQLD